MNLPVKHILLYMKIADAVAEMSVAKRLKVGSVVVKNNNIIGFGWNGTPTGWDNECEDREYMDRGAGGWLDPEEIWERWPLEDDTGRYRLKTKPEVIHSESNALMKIARSTESSEGSTMFCTHAPCLDCAKLIYQSGIKQLYYREQYRSEDGIKFLEKSGVSITRYE